MNVLNFMNEGSFKISMLNKLNFKYIQACDRHPCRIKVPAYLSRRQRSLAASFHVPFNASATQALNLKNSQITQEVCFQMFLQP